MEYPISEEKRQHDWNKFSMWSLMSKYYEAKENYYSGAPKLTDQEFDALEGSIKAIHGKGFLQKWGCVGYDYNKHLAVKLIFARWQFVDRENQKLHNFWAKEKNLLIGIDFSVNESESVGVLFEKKSGKLEAVAEFKGTVLSDIIGEFESLYDENHEFKEDSDNQLVMF